MTCANCAATVERALRRTPGVREAAVSYASERATGRYDEAAVAPEDLVRSVERVGYGATLASPDAIEDVEAQSRAEEIRVRTRDFLLGAALSVPLLVLSMGRDFGLLGAWAHAPWVNFLFLALATPVQLWVARGFYVGAWKSLRNGSANMDVLVALGSSVAYGYSVVLT